MMSKSALRQAKRNPLLYLINKTLSNALTMIGSLNPFLSSEDSIDEHIDTKEALQNIKSLPSELVWLNKEPEADLVEAFLKAVIHGDDGKALLLTGPKASGKTTLVFKMFELLNYGLDTDLYQEKVQISSDQKVSGSRIFELNELRFPALLYHIFGCEHDMQFFKSIMLNIKDSTSRDPSLAARKNFFIFEYTGVLQHPSSFLYFRDLHNFFIVEIKKPNIETLERMFVFYAKEHRLFLSDERMTQLAQNFFKLIHQQDLSLPELGQALFDYMEENNNQPHQEIGCYVRMDDDDSAILFSQRPAGSSQDSALEVYRRSPS
jgi:hypothetical protein